MPPLTPTRTWRCGGWRSPAVMPARPVLLALAGEVDLALGDLFEGDRQEVLAARSHKRRRKLVEHALAERVVVVVDLPRALGGDDGERIPRVARVGQQLVDAGTVH